MWQKHLPRLVTSLVLLYLTNGHAQIANFDVRLGNLLHMQQGIGWPLHLKVAEGHEALMRLSEHLENQQTCEVTTPAGLKFNVHNPLNNRFETQRNQEHPNWYLLTVILRVSCGHWTLADTSDRKLVICMAVSVSGAASANYRYEAWSDGCGVRVRNVVLSDAGRWRMTATRGNHSITGWSEMYVTEQITSYTPDTISLQDGHAHTLVDLSSLNNSYCLVAQPFSESSLVAGHCHVTLDRTTRAVQGRWSVLLGIPGRVTELHVDTNVTVQAESLDVGYVREADNHKLHIYCNILHTTKNITFCRFQKSTEVSGFNVMDGLSDGRYSYYGLGFFKRQCGLTIESVTDQDYGTWRCTIGVMERVGNAIHQLTPMQALVTVPVDGGTRIRRSIERSDQQMRKLFVQQNSNVTILCRADASLAYCWYQHPNGSQFTPVERHIDEEQAFWYTGENLQSGDCGITFANVSKEDAGKWTCHMGYKYQLGVEIMDQVEVRVTGPLAANEKEVGAGVGGSATLYCHTSNGPRPLDYCRFLAPNYVGMSLDSSVDEHNAILDRFFFSPGKNLDYGDCSLTISPVYAEDFGEWTCAALLHDQVVESRDTVVLYPSSGGMSRLAAGLIGTSVSIVFLALVFAVTVWYKKGRPLPTIPWSWPNPLQRFSNRSDNTSFDLNAPTESIERRGSNSTTSSSNTSSNELAGPA